MARNTKSNGKSNARIKLSRASVAAVALAATVPVALFQTGHTTAALAVAVGLYLLVSRGVAPVAMGGPGLRLLCWSVVAVALTIAATPSAATGGPALGVALAVSLATALRCTRATGRKSRR
jgi:hypothetical protein